MAQPRPLGVIPLGDSAAYVEFSEKLDLEVNSVVQRLGLAITVGTTNSTVFRPPAGTILSLVGGPINIGAPPGTPGFAPGGTLPPGFVLVNGGRLNMVSVASAGEARFDGRGFNVDGFAQLGDINIKQRSMVDAKEVFIRGGRLTIDTSAIIPGFFRTQAFGGVPDGGEVNVKVTNDMTVTGNSLIFGFRSGIYTFNPPPAVTANPTIPAPRDVPDINIEARSVHVSGLSNIQSERFAPGNAADVVIKTDSLQVRNGAVVAVNNFFGGAGGSLTINARDVVLSGDGNTGFTGISGQSNFNMPFYSGTAVQDIRRDPRLTNGDGATVNVNASGTLTVRQGAEISTDSFAFGRAGDINVQVGDALLSRDGAATGSIASQSLFAGPAGNLKISATGKIAMSGGFQISATTGGTGDGGTMNVSAGQSISIDGPNTGIFSATVLPPQNRLDQFANRLGSASYAALLTRLGLPATATLPQVLARTNTFIVGTTPLTVIPDLTIGNAGRIGVATPLLAMSNASRIDSSTGWDGNAGEIVADLGSLNLMSGAKIRSGSGLVRLATGVLEVGSGNAGKVTINASESIAISGQDSAVSTTTFGSGQGGTVELTSGGNVTVSDGGSVTSDSFGTGLTGDINITAADSIMLERGTISTRATTSDGGNIRLLAKRMIRFKDSRVTTSVESGTGGGGNIFIDPQFVILNGSAITANAFGGPGGNITIVADNFLTDSTSQVQASSALSTPGTIQIRSPENNLAEAVAQLPKELVDASRLMQGACSARRAGAPSSFTVAGRGGVPADPDGYLPSYSTAAAPDAGARAAAGERLALAMAGWDCWR